MAHYKRDILVPYLNDVCSMEMLCAKLAQEVSNAQYSYAQWYTWFNQHFQRPSRPSKESPSAAGYYVVTGIGMIFLLIALGIMPYTQYWDMTFYYVADFIRIIGAVLIFLGGFLIFIGIKGRIDDVKDADRKYQEACSQYKEQVKQYNLELDRKSYYKNELDRSKNQLESIKMMYNRAMKEKDHVYSVNIIPSDYRNIHVAYYLYKYFSTSREDDLDKIIQTLLLEEIKKRLDTLVQQNEEILINQRLEIALQEEQNRSIAKNHRDQMIKVAQLEANQELQNDYLNMIACNQSVTNFFLAEDYLKGQPIL